VDSVVEEFLLLNEILVPVDNVMEVLVKRVEESVEEFVALADENDVPVPVTALFLKKSISLASRFGGKSRGRKTADASAK